MAERLLNPRSYTIVFAILAGLTALTVGISFIPLGGTGHIVLGLAIATIKATLVVLFFMHALAGERLTLIVIAVAVAWLLLLLVLTLTDYFSRDLVPYMPGH